MDFKGPKVNILIVKLSAIGDVIHTLPSLVALRALYPGAHITWVVEEAAADLVRHHPCLDEVLVSRRKTWGRNFRRGELRNTFNEIRTWLKTLRQRHYDLVIDFHGLFKSAFIVFLSGGKRKLGYDSWQELSGLFLNEKIAEKMNKHAVDRYLDFPRYLGAQIDHVQFILPLGKSSEEKVKMMMDRYHLKEKQFVAINPIALWDTKLWSDEKFSRLAHLIYDHLKMDVVFTGSDQETLGKIVTPTDKVIINLGGHTSLIELACLYKQARLVISTDSGPMHLAAAVGTPVAALFGPTDPARTGPYGRGHTVITSGMNCSPCFLKKCRTKKCMENISVEQVFSVVKKMIKE